MADWSKGARLATQLTRQDGSALFDTPFWAIVVFKGRQMENPHILGGLSRHGRGTQTFGGTWGAGLKPAPPLASRKGEVQVVGGGPILPNNHDKKTGHVLLISWL